MIATYCLLLVVGSARAAEPCPTWFYRSQNGDCICGDELNGAVTCDNTTHRVGVGDCFCMTSNGDNSDTTVVGRCIFNCANSTSFMKDGLYHRVTSNTSALTKNACGYLHRQGRLCGECEPGYHTPVYSYVLECIECQTKNGWVKYISAAFLPLTLFYIIILVFQFSANSPQITAVLLFAQYISIPANGRIVLQSVVNAKSTPFLYIVKTFLTIYGIWNLDFFRAILLPICLEVTTLQGLALDYVTAFYPLLLIVFSCILFRMYDSRYRLIVLIWTPFSKLFGRFREGWSSKTSIIDVFATFLLLSYVKLVSVSFDILVPTRVWDVYGASKGLYLYYDSTIEFLGAEHLPYAILAFTILLVAGVLPLLLLLLYPMLCFQRLLNFLRVNYEGIRVFVECFQGCYQDRTDRGKEYRYFGALPLFIRLVAYVIYVMTADDLFYPVFATVSIATGALYLLFQPYKHQFSFYNKVDGGFYILLAFWCIGIVISDIASSKDPRYKYVGVSLTSICTIVPLVYITAITIHWICNHIHGITESVGKLRKKDEEKPLLNHSSNIHQINTPK